MNHVYFDFNANTPVAPQAAADMRPFIDEQFGNASATHWAGQRMRAAIERARGDVAELLNAKPSEVVFTSGGTESNNMALGGILFGDHGKQWPHLIVSRVEHPSILQVAAFWERLGGRVTQVAVDSQGKVDPREVERAIQADTVLISIMHANNEVGTLQPIREIAAVARARQVLVHTDAAQSVGKVAVDVQDLGVDLLTVAGHKMYAPAGVGVLYLREGVRLDPFLRGAGHESGRRAGTENTLEIVGLGAASKVAHAWLQNPSIRDLRDYFWDELRGAFGDQVVLNGHPTDRLPNTLNVSFVGRKGREILAEIPELAASTGSACHAGQDHLSPVLKAMGITERVGLGAIRFSLGRSSTRDEIDWVVSRLREVLSGRAA